MDKDVLAIFFRCYRVSQVIHCKSYQSICRYHPEEKPIYKLTYSIHGIDKWTWADRSPIKQATLTDLLRRNNG